VNANIWPWNVKVVNSVFSFCTLFYFFVFLSTNQIAERKKRDNIKHLRPYKVKIMSFLMFLTFSQQRLVLLPFDAFRYYCYYYKKKPS